MNINRLSRQSGFTLVETIISVGLIVVVAALITSTTVITQKMFYGQKSEAKMQRDSKKVMAYISQDVRMAFIVLDTYPEDTQEYSYASSSQTIILKMRSIDSSGHPISGSYDYIIYTMSPNEGLLKLTISDPSSNRTGGTEALSEFVRDFEILYDGTTYEYAPHPSSTINIYIKLSPEPDSEEDVYELQTEIMVRNANR